ncbi:MAG: ribonuclease T2 family protein, partial [Parvibaculum sp.]
MGRYTGFIALGLMIAAAAVYSFLQADAPVERASPPASPQAEMPSTSQDNAKPSDPSAVSEVPQGSGFDFYVLSLSWSPTFCDSEAAGRNREQCGPGTDFGWVVHGLWPQNEKGWPENCPTPEGSRVPERIGRTVIDIMPSMGLIGHQWRKHGSCSGLSQRDYFSATRAAFEAIRLPERIASGAETAALSADAIETAFTD